MPFFSEAENVDGRDKPGHDDAEASVFYGTISLRSMVMVVVVVVVMMPVAAIVMMVVMMIRELDASLA
jgi:hypothetical protein